MVLLEPGLGQIRQLSRLQCVLMKNLTRGTAGSVFLGQLEEVMDVGGLKVL